MLMVRLAKIAMTAALAAFAFIVTYDNLIDYGSNYEFVKHVLSMDTTFPGNKLMDRPSPIRGSGRWHARSLQPRA